MRKAVISLFAYSFVAVAVFTVQTHAQPAGNTKAPAKANPLDKGDFKVGFPPGFPGKKPMNADDKAGLQGIADSLNGVIALPKNVYLNVDQCGEANAFYESESSQIKICYELLDQFEDEFKTITKDPVKVENMVEDTLVQTLFHELGHCLIDVWDLPATGREEDAVDQLATVIMLDGTPSGQASAINAALEFKIASENETKDDMLFWDEHSFSATRFYDMLCLVYGSNPQKNGRLVGANGLPQERAERCDTEYKRANHAWLKLLSPYILN
ncbi:MAG: hypothetical protein JO053_05275 [Acidobacteria bacterium]|nr:hypothetical protein [Acidobacteriota bacterium]